MSSAKPRRVLRDNIQGISRPALRRLAHRAGVKTVSGLCYAELRGIMMFRMEQYLKDVVIATELSGRKTVKVSDLEVALENANQYLGAATHPTKKGNTFNKTQVYQSGSKSKTSEPNERSHRWRQGTVSLRDIRYQQKNSDSLAIPRLNFSRLTREICQNFSSDLQFSRKFMELFQLVIESYLEELVEDSYLISMACKRQTLMPKDLQLARRIRHERR